MSDLLERAVLMSKLRKKNERLEEKVKRLETTLKNQKHTCGVLAKDKERLEAELERRERLTVNMDLEHRAENARLRDALEQSEAKIEAQAEYIMTANRVNNNLKKQLDE